MKVIFTQNFKGVAYKGEVKIVKDGFYQNYLQPKKMAIPATEKNLKEWESLRNEIMMEKEQLKSRLAETQKRLSSGALQIAKKVTAKGTLYGGVKAADIVSAIADQLKMEVPHNSVKVTDHIKKVGTYTVTLNLGDGFTADIPVEVVEKK